MCEMQCQMKQINLAFVRNILILYYVIVLGFGERASPSGGKTGETGTDVSQTVGHIWK